MEIPDTKTSLEIMGRLDKIPARQLTKVRNKNEVIAEARNQGRKVHFAQWHPSEAGEEEEEEEETSSSRSSARWPTSSWPCCGWSSCGPETGTGYGFGF